MLGQEYVIILLIEQIKKMISNIGKPRTHIENRKNSIGFLFV